MEKNISKEGHAGSPGLFENLRRQMNRLVDDFSVRGPGLLGAEGTFIPRVDIEESETEIAVTAEIPGIEQGDLSVSFLQGMLEIRGEKREERRGGWRGRRSVERRYGFFRRVVALPPEADTANATATFKNGVLTVSFPKKPEALEARRRIEVTEGEKIIAEGEKITFKPDAGRVEEVKGSGIYPPDTPNPPKDAVQRAERSLGGDAGYQKTPEAPPSGKKELLEDDKP